MSKTFHYFQSDLIEPNSRIDLLVLFVHCFLIFLLKNIYLIIYFVFRPHQLPILFIQKYFAMKIFSYIDFSGDMEHSTRHIFR